MKKLPKFLLRTLVCFIAILIIYWGGMYIFFRIKKDEISKTLKEEISNSIHGEFLMRDLGMNFFNSFPFVAISLRDVEMRDSAWQTHKQSFLKAKKIFLTISPLSLLGKQVKVSKAAIENGSIITFRDINGYENTYMIQKKDEKKTTEKSTQKTIDLDEIGLKNVRIIKKDAIKNKLFDLQFKKLKIEIGNGSEKMGLEVKIDAFVNGLGFNLAKGSYLKGQSLEGKFDATYNKTSREISFSDIQLEIDNKPLRFSGIFDLSEKKDFQLAINAGQMDYSSAIRLLPEKISAKLSPFSIDKPVTIVADIKGKMVYLDKPTVNVKMKATNVILSSTAGDFSNASFDGSFSNAVNDTLVRNDSNSRLTVENFTASWEQIPLKSKKITITNLTHPFLEMDIEANAPLANLNTLMNSSSFEFINGMARLEATYSGPLAASDTTTNVNGFMLITDGRINYIPRQVELENLNGKIIFFKNDVRIQDLTAEAKSSKLTINANIRNMFAFMEKDPSKLFLDAEITSPMLDVFAFKTMLGSRKSGNKKATGKLSGFAQKMDKFMEMASISTHLKAAKIKYKKFTADNVDAVFNMNGDLWNLKHIVLHHSNGQIRLAGSLTSGKSNYNVIDVNANLDNVDISKVFSDFNNFGMQSLHAENLKGRLTSDIHLNAVLNDESEVLPSTLTGTVDLSLRDGELVNFEPLNKMAVFVLKKRDFSRVEFAEIKNSFQINKSLVTISKMEIQSNILGLLLEGIYDIKGKSTDLVIQVPIKYLKKRQPDYVPENQGTDAKRGISIYVRAQSTENGEIAFKYGLFKKKADMEKEEVKKEKEKPPIGKSD